MNLMWLLSRGAKRGRDKSKEIEKDETQIRKRQQARDAEIKEMRKEMQRMSDLVQRRNNAAMIKKVLKVTTDEAQKKKLEEKLVEIVLNM